MIIQRNAYHVSKLANGNFAARRGSVLDDYPLFCQAWSDAHGSPVSPFHKLPEAPKSWCQCHRPGKDVQERDGVLAVVVEVSGDYPACFNCGGAFEQ